MGTDRELRDELERTQAELKRLKAALDDPGSLFPDRVARVEQLTGQRKRLWARLHDSRAELQALESALVDERRQVKLLRAELTQATNAETELVTLVVGRLDAGPKTTGCASALLVLAVAAAVAAAGALA